MEYRWRYVFWIGSCWSSRECRAVQQVNGACRQRLEAALPDVDPSKNVPFSNKTMLQLIVPVFNKEKLDKLDDVEILPHPAYSFNLAPSDYVLFRSMEHFLRQRRDLKLLIKSNQCTMNSLSPSRRIGTEIRFDNSQNADSMKSLRMMGCFWRIIVIDFE
jgi:hypothetical protein